MNENSEQKYYMNNDGRIRNIYGYYMAEFLVQNGFFTDLLRIVKNPREGHEKCMVYVFRESDDLNDAIAYYTNNISQPSQSEENKKTRMTTKKVESLFVNEGCENE